jgi:hypothetical protein
MFSWPTGLSKAQISNHSRPFCYTTNPNEWLFHAAVSNESISHLERVQWFKTVLVRKKTCFNVESTCKVCGFKSNDENVLLASGRNFMSPAPHRETRQLCRVHIWSPIYLDEHFSVFFLVGGGQFCDVAKVMMIHKKN